MRTSTNTTNNNNTTTKKKKNHLALIKRGLVRRDLFALGVPAKPTHRSFFARRNARPIQPPGEGRVGEEEGVEGTEGVEARRGGREGGE